MRGSTGFLTGLTGGGAGVHVIRFDRAARTIATVLFMDREERYWSVTAHITAQANETSDVVDDRLYAKLLELVNDWRRQQNSAPSPQKK